jgi:acyl carrier protein
MIPASPLSSFPASVQDAHSRWLRQHDPADLAAVVLAVVDFHRPGSARAARPDAALPDSARLVEDLGYDSLALAEVVFFFEDLYRVTISNDALRRIATIADLRSFVLEKVAAGAPAAAALSARPA